MIHCPPEGLLGLGHSSLQADCGNSALIICSVHPLKVSAVFTARQEAKIKTLLGSLLFLSLIELAVRPGN